MDLATAQAIMADASIPDADPQKAAARAVLLAEAQRLEAALAALNSDSDDDDAATPVTVTATTTATATPDVALSLTEAQRVMGDASLADDHPTKVAARKVLLAEAARLEASMAALDADSDDDESTAATPSTSTATATGASATSRPKLTLAEAHEIMAHVPSLPDTHPRKIEAKRVLLQEADRIQASLAAATTVPTTTVSQHQPGIKTPAALAGKMSHLDSIIADAESMHHPDAKAASEQAARLARESVDQSSLQGLGAKREKEHDAALYKKPAPKIDRKYATEEERIHAEANLEETTSRLSEIAFDFSFGASEGSTASSSNKDEPKKDTSTDSSAFSFNAGSAWQSAPASTSQTAAHPAGDNSSTDTASSEVDDWTARKIKQLAAMVDTPSNKGPPKEDKPNWIEQARLDALAKKAGQAPQAAPSAAAETTPAAVDTSSSSSFVFKSFSTGQASEPAASATPTQNTQPKAQQQKPKEKEQPLNVSGAHKAVNRQWIERMRQQAQGSSTSVGSAPDTAAAQPTQASSTSSASTNQPLYKRIGPVNPDEEASEEKTTARLSDMQFNFKFG